MRVVVKEFSLDDAESALSRMSRLLQATSDEIGKNLTLDSEQSALFRLRRELIGVVDGMVQKNGEFQAEVREALSSMQVRRAEAARSTRHGEVFEAAVGQLLADEAQRLNDIFEATGATTGTIRNSKVGDHVITLGPDSPAPNAAIVVEAKENKAYTLKEALAESEVARKNRGAQVGIFVFSRRAAPSGLQPFTRYGDDLVVVWDADDAASDLYLRCAYSMARALVVRLRHENEESSEAVQRIERAARAVEKQADFLDKVVTWAETAVKSGTQIVERARSMREELARQVAVLDEQTSALKLEA